MERLPFDFPVSSDRVLLWFRLLTYCLREEFIWPGMDSMGGIQAYMDGSDATGCLRQRDSMLHDTTAIRCEVCATLLL